MALTLYEPVYQLFLNGFDITANIKPYLISITLEDSFDTNFTQSKIELIIHSKYQRLSSTWTYKDTLQIKVWWKVLPQNEFVSGVFYVDYIEDLKAAGGNQTYRVGALEANPELGFTYGQGDIVYLNTTVSDALNNFATTFNLNLVTTIQNDIYLGVIDKNDDPANTFFRKEYTSFAEMLKDICNTFSYLGNLSGTDLTIIAINSDFDINERFFVWKLDECFDFSSKQTYNELFKQYSGNFVDRTDNDTIKEAVLSPSMENQLNNKKIFVNENDTYFNLETVSEVVNGTMLKGYLDGFEVSLKMSAIPNVKAGNMFLLDASYGNHEGYYRCTKVVHRINNGGWETEILGFPIKKLDSTRAIFDLGYTGRVENPDDPAKVWNLNEDYGVRNYNLGANKYDEFAKSLNPNYTENFGNIFLTYGNSSYDIDPAVIFCMCMVMSDNFRRDDYMDAFNPIGMSTLTGEALATFPNFDTGIKATVQHFYAYAHIEDGTHPDLSPPELVDPRFDFVIRGSAPLLSDLDGKWTARLDFSELVIAKVIQFYQFSYPDWQISFTYS